MKFKDSYLIEIDKGDDKCPKCELGYLHEAIVDDYINKNAVEVWRCNHCKALFEEISGVTLDER